MLMNKFIGVFLVERNVFPLHVWMIMLMGRSGECISQQVSVFMAFLIMPDWAENHEMII